MFSLHSSDAHCANLSNWTIKSEVKEDWSIVDGALHMCVQEGNIWGGWYQEVCNTFVYPHISGQYSAEIHVTLTPRLTFEQAGLGIYWDNANYIKISKELFDGKLSLVFVTEQKGSPKVNQRIDYQDESVDIKLEKSDGKVTAFYRTNKDSQWITIQSVDALAGEEEGLMLYTFSGDKSQPNEAVFRDLRVSS
ncbi:DUF1349 domain-containing protein [Vibrio maerlii]|uniref:DUF1349 domain-containing protein n=1 Tax=Vibrio maerlii TaxID=2231648 RepID=UPI000E3C7909|nr:DUF1349 domain-containing protein [Vibrio maerlii]